MTAAERGECTRYQLDRGYAWADDRSMTCLDDCLRGLVFLAAAALTLAGGCQSDDGVGDTDAANGRYCPEVEPWPETERTCRPGGTCESDKECARGPSAAGVCGGATGCSDNVGQPDGCLSTDDCVGLGDNGEDGICEFNVDQCCGDVSRCVLPCTADSCPSDEVCEATGLCAPESCDVGYACAAGTRCEAGAAGSDEHGCVSIPCEEEGATPCSPVEECVSGSCTRLDCSRDGDCPCGTCANGKCWTKPWVCIEYPA